MKDMTTKIQRWFLENNPEDCMSYKQIWWKNNVFIRDRLLKLFNSSKAEVVGQHYSKSIKCPVIKTTYKGIEIIWQYNFYDWQIMVKSNKHLNLRQLKLYEANGDYLYYQGIPEEYRFKKYSKTNSKEFAINISSSDELDVWGFALELRKAIGD